jgi:hypothetical protein
MTRFMTLLGLVMVRGNPRVSRGISVPLPTKTCTLGEGYEFLQVGVEGFQGSERLKTPEAIVP